MNLGLEPRALAQYMTWPPSKGPSRLAAVVFTRNNANGVEALSPGLDRGTRTYPGNRIRMGTNRTVVAAGWNVIRGQTNDLSLYHPTGPCLETRHLLIAREERRQPGIVPTMIPIKRALRRIGRLFTASEAEIQLSLR